MTRLRRLLILIVTLITLCGGREARATADLDAALSAWEKKEYDEAYRKLRAVVEEDRRLSAELLHSLGCVSVRRKNFGEAVLWFRRAKLMNPRYPEATQNLDFIKTKEYAFGSLPVSGMQWYASLLKHRTWRWIVSAGGWGTAVCAALLAFLSLPVAGRIAAWTGVAFFLLLAAGGAFGLLGRLDGKKLELRYVVTTPQPVMAYTAPTERGGEVIELPPGTEVRWKTTRDQWCYVDLPNDRVGWLRQEWLTRLWPWSRDLLE